MYKLGIDLGGTNIVAGVVDENYNIVATGKVKTNLPRPAKEVVDDMVKAANIAIENAGLKIEDIDSMGVGSPGAIDPVNGVVCYANNLGFYDVPMAQMLKERMGVDFYIENDANAAAYGEYIAGAGRGTNNFIAITLGTGVGGGVIINGKLYSGSNYAGAELGHTVIDVNGPLCTCGRKGCFEVYSSATGLINMTREFAEKDKNSKLWDFRKEGEFNGRTAFLAAKEGDETAKAVVEKYTDYLAVGIANIINIFQPEIFVIGGGVSNEGDNLINPLKERLAPFKSVRTASLKNDAGIIGAAALVLHRD